MHENIAVRPEDGFDHWHAVTCRDYSITECRAISDHAFSAGVAIQSLGPLKLSEIWSSVDEPERLQVRRRDQDIRRDGRDDFMLWLTIEGSTFFEQDGRAVALAPGDMMLHDQSRPFALEFGPQSRNVMATIPRSLLVSRLPNSATLVARKMAGGSPLVALSGQLARDVMRSGDALSKTAASRLVGAAIDLWACTIETNLDALVGRDSARLHRRLIDAKRYMLDRLADSDLSVDNIAGSLHMSSRTLVRLFAKEGETPMRWLWRRRLDSAYRLLAERRVSHVHEAAIECGFVDMSHFSRAFRAAFGHSPLEVLGKSSNAAR